MIPPAVGRTIAWVAFALLLATMGYDRLKWRLSPVAEGGISVGQIVWRVGLTLVALGAGYMWLARG
jgi:hypothetical protein